ncbi:hypothetical protein NE857_12625 [Nocardiopsis exhalans]|uniref:ATP-binding protein n=1 Tax=Nocardiopsis exhalans TaxID=163604 RepID=A0ABY5DGS4_9ACTN|nr:hypothetical protein [Nocardiopsis exhalans]USY22373.1 hypothetical protein NE857_12625 [Nocardiopsis exhalans]
MNATQQRPPAPQDRYPRRLRLEHPTQHGILLNHTRDYRALTNWCRSALPSHGARLAKVARLLVENSHQHSRSGLPSGTVRVVLDQSRHLLPHLFVTDQGPLDASTIDYPHLNPRNPRSGLAIVDKLSVYWDFSWTWDGHRIKHTTLQVVFDLTTNR